MSLLQKAVETYDQYMLSYGAQTQKGSAMAPLAHIVTRADLCITLEADGSFVDAQFCDVILLMNLVGTTGSLSSFR